LATVGEFIRFCGILTVSVIGMITRRYERIRARLLRRDLVVARTERKFRALLESAPDAMVIVDWHGHIQLVNAQTERLFGYRRDVLAGQGISELIPERFRANHRDHVRGYMHDAHPRAMGGGLELLGRRKDGTEFPVEISLGPLETEQGLLISGAIRDVTERKRAEAALRDAEELFRTAFEEAPVGIALAGLDGRILKVNRALCDLTGHSREQLEATTFASITHPEDGAIDAIELHRLIAGEAKRYRAERRFLHAQGHPVPVDLSVAVVTDADGVPRNMLAQVHDMTERKRFEGQLQYLADHDALTGMFNRRRFDEELEKEIARGIRYGAGGALLAVDLDHFKFVNDSLGHSAGDELIARVSWLFRSRLRGTDTLARLGGDEFGVILPGVTKEQALLVAQGLRDALRSEAKATSPGAPPKWVSASIGVTLLDGTTVSGEEKLVEADIAMYDAKEAGRDRVALYDPARDRQGRMQARLTWAERIRDALEIGNFVLHAQPILSLGHDPVPRHELLIRMRGEGDDLIPPGTFLYIGERFELIQAIDRWVIRQAIEILATEKRAGHEVSLALNLSAKSVVDEGLPAFVAGELANAGIDGRGLCVEVTETAAIVNVARARTFAHELSELGCEFALDDFWAGFASFYYLKHMVFDFVKIDGEFIRNLPESRINQLVVQSVVGIARGLGKQTIAEFVGDQETVALLRGYGIDYAQGFYVARPPLEQLDLGLIPVLPTGV
jgi:diguanylate cyclase (GGDEF)-like protein/PAS domain S-box-containing protein